jgi:hypothetical protein
MDHAHEPDANYADPYHRRISDICKILRNSMLSTVPTVPTVLACFSAILVNSLKFSLRLKH